MQTTRLKLLARTYLTFHGRLDFLPDKLQPVVLASRSFVVGQEITEIDARLPAPTSTNASLADTRGFYSAAISTFPTAGGGRLEDAGRRTCCAAVKKSETLSTKCSTANKQVKVE